MSVRVPVESTVVIVVMEDEDDLSESLEKEDVGEVEQANEGVEGDATADVSSDVVGESMNENVERCSGGRMFWSGGARWRRVFVRAEDYKGITKLERTSWWKTLDAGSRTLFQF